MPDWADLDPRVLVVVATAERKGLLAMRSQTQITGSAVSPAICASVPQHGVEGSLGGRSWPSVEDGGHICGRIGSYDVGGEEFSDNSERELRLWCPGFRALLSTSTLRVPQHRARASIECRSHGKDAANADLRVDEQP